jgi:hypothetical protein
MKVSVINRYALHLCPVKKHPAELLPCHVPETFIAGCGGPDVTFPQEPNSSIPPIRMAESESEALGKVRCMASHCIGRNNILGFSFNRAQRDCYENYSKLGQIK